MTQYWIVYDATTGEERWRGEGPDGALARQSLPEGLAAIEVPQSAILGPTDMDAVRDFWKARVDTGAETFRLRFITPGSGQALQYQRKEAQARAFAANPAALVPALEKEAAATGQTVAEVASSIIQRADFWATKGDDIEAARLAAKRAIADAANIAEIHAAATVDWEAVLA